MKKQIVTGLIGAASLLAMAASGAYAAWPYKTCTSGTISTIYAGPAYYTDGQGVAVSGQTLLANGCTRMIKMTCTEGDLAGKSGTYCVYKTIDADGILATALTAADGGKYVDYTLYDNHTDATGNWGNGLILSLSLHTGTN